MLAILIGTLPIAVLAVLYSFLERKVITWLCSFSSSFFSTPCDSLLSFPPYCRRLKVGNPALGARSCFSSLSRSFFWT